MTWRDAVLLLTIALQASAESPVKPNWLDAAPTQWNKAGATIPRAKKINLKDEDLIPKMCLSHRNAPRTPQEQEVAAKGWMLFGSWRDGSGRDVVVVGAMANLDGMCRPDLYQDFVFVNGTFAGTLSPKSMGARSDASSFTVAFPVPGKIYAEFARYTDKDPLCCPSRVSEVTYDIQDVRGKPVVILANVRTRSAN